MNRIVQYVFLFAAVSTFTSLLRACSPNTSAQRGQELFDLHCASCHVDPPTYLKKQPPRLESLFKTKHLPSGVPATDKQVRKTIIEGLRTMPGFDQRLSDQDVNDLIAYLHTFR